MLVHCQKLTFLAHFIVVQSTKALEYTDCIFAEGQNSPKE